MTWPPRNKGSEEKRYDEDEEGSQEGQIKSENNEDGQCHNAEFFYRNKENNFMFGSCLTEYDKCLLSLKLVKKKNRFMTPSPTNGLLHRCSN